jgi:superfamily I DNA/RNA helicase
VARKYITILCFTKEQINSFIAANPKKYVEGAFEVEGFINISTIHSYKGLENQFIIICGPREYIPEDKKQMSLIYIANTRATSQSIFFINSRFVHVIVDRINSSL